VEIRSGDLRGLASRRDVDVGFLEGWLSSVSISGALPLSCKALV
jgi:hypothetical protein